METKRLIPYSVHLPDDIYAKLKAAAGERKASAMVRDAITMIVSGTTPFNSGYNKGLKDASKVIQTDPTVKGLVINGIKVGFDADASVLVDEAAIVDPYDLNRVLNEMETHA